MGWFGKKKKKAEMSYSLPEMPKLPELPKIGDDLSILPQLPSQHSDSFSDSLDEKFSQGVIKDAISGEEDGDEGGFEANEFFPESKERMMQKPPKYLAKEISTEKTRTLSEIKGQGFIKTRTKESEPVFVRIDKFEESLDTFEKTKKKLVEMEKFLSEIKRIREREESELQEWENEVQVIKKQFEKIDRDLFSKI